MDFRGRFGDFVSVHEIPFPGNRDFGSKRRGSNAGLLSREAEGRIEEVEQERDQAREDRPNALETLVERLIDICLTHHHSIDDVITWIRRAAANRRLQAPEPESPSQSESEGPAEPEPAAEI